MLELIYYGNFDYKICKLREGANSEQRSKLQEVERSRIACDQVLIYVNAIPSNKGYSL